MRPHIRAISKIRPDCTEHSNKHENPVPNTRSPVRGRSVSGQYPIRFKRSIVLNIQWTEPQDYLKEAKGFRPKAEGKIDPHGLVPCGEADWSASTEARIAPFAPFLTDSPLKNQPIR